MNRPRSLIVLSLATFLAVSSCCKKDDPVEVPLDSPEASPGAVPNAVPAGTTTGAADGAVVAPHPTGTTAPRDAGAVTVDGGVRADGGTGVAFPPLPTGLPSGLAVPSSWPAPPALGSGFPFPTPPKVPR